MAQVNRENSLSERSSSATTYPTRDIDDIFLSVRVKKLLSDAKNLSNINSKIYNDLKSDKISDSTKILNELNTVHNEMASLRDDLDKCMTALYKERVRLYENLLTTCLARYYYEISKDALDESLRAERIRLYTDPTINPEMVKKLNEMSIMCTQLSDSSLLQVDPNNDELKESNDIKFNSTIINNIKSLSNYFNNLYNDIKSSVDLDETFITKTGVTGLKKVYKIGGSESQIEGMIRFYNSSNTEVDIIKDGAIDVKSIRLNLNAKTDIILQEGSENNPYIINNEKDFRRYTRSSSKKHFKLGKDLSVTLLGKVRFAGNLDGDGHSLKIIGGDILLPAGSTVKNLKLMVVSAVTDVLDITDRIIDLKGSMENVDIFTHGDRKVIPTPPFIVKSDIKIISDDIDGMSVVSLKNVTLRIPNNKTGCDVKISEAYVKASYKIEEGQEQKDILCLENSDEMITEVFSLEPDKGNGFKGSNKTYEAKNISAGENIIYDETLTYDESSGYFIDSDSLSTSKIAIEMSKDLKSKITFKLIMYETKPEESNDENDSGGSTYIPYEIDLVESINGTEFDCSSTLFSYKYGDMDISVMSNELEFFMLLGKVASYLFIDDKIKDCNNDADKNLLIYTLGVDIANLREILDIVTEDLSNKKADSLDKISKITQSLTTIDGFRATNDSNFDSSLTTNLSSLLNDVSSFSGMISMGLDISDVIDVQSKVSSSLKLVEDETNVLAMTIAESIIKVNSVIDNFLGIHAVDNLAGNALKNAAVSYANAIYSTLDQDNMSIAPGHIRLFSDWREDFEMYSADGISALSQLYMVQELCINVINFEIDSNDRVNIALKSIVNNILLSMYKKKLLFSGGQMVIIEELEYEKELVNDHNIQVSENAPYEIINPVIGDMDKNLKLLNTFDTMELIFDSSTFDDPSNKFNKLFSMSISKYIFKDSIPYNIMERIRLLHSNFTTCVKNFKTILLEFYFRSFLKRILNISSSDTNSIIYNYNKELSEYIETDEIKDILEKYSAVWKFNFIARYSPVSSILNVLESQQGGIKRFLYNRSGSITDNRYPDGDVINPSNSKLDSTISAVKSGVDTAVSVISQGANKIGSVLKDTFDPLIDIWSE